MSDTILVVEDDAFYRGVLRDWLAGEGYVVVDVETAEDALEMMTVHEVSLLLTDLVLPGISGIELMEKIRDYKPGLPIIVMTGHGTSDAVVAALRNHACDFLAKPFKMEELDSALHSALARPGTCEIEVISATRKWIEIRVPCDLSAVDPIQRFLRELECDLPKETREAIAAAFHEMLTNAIEHGGKCDPTKLVDIKWIRLSRAILYSIKDPGEGFDIESIKHAAIANPQDDPYRHLAIREEKMLRPGGFGIMLVSQVMDELIYNEKHNELILVKYVDDEQVSEETTSRDAGPR